MQIVKRTLIVIFCLLLIPITAVSTSALKARGGDGPNRVFSGGPLVSGDFYRGPEPSWSFVNTIPTIEMQLLNPSKSRRIWTVEHDEKLYVWSGYMNNPVGKLWKSWPGQAVGDGRAIFRIHGQRYERQLIRVNSGAELDGIAQAISNKYPSQTTRDTIESGQVWLFEAASR